jgi:Cft2 family RNA processing exonuclease
MTPTPITITHLGADICVTGSCHLVRFQPDHGSGIVYIPAFALGRTQELIYELDRINPGVSVFIDSPLGIEITRLYQDMDDCRDREAKALKAAGRYPAENYPGNGKN